MKVVDCVDKPTKPGPMGPHHPVAAAARSACPAMPTSSLPVKEAHRDKLFAAAAPLMNPYTDTMYEVVGFRPSRDSKKRKKTRYGPKGEVANVAVARSVNKAEMKLSPKALAAMNAEWTRHQEIKTWLEDKVENWRDVQERARRSGKQIHIGRVFPILVEKNSELDEDDPLRKFKGRVVYDGSFVRDQDGNVALFQELSSCPATMQAGKAADGHGCFPGHTIEQADAKAGVYADRAKRN